jgi:hypothetical protein
MEVGCQRGGAEEGVVQVFLEKCYPIITITDSAEQRIGTSIEDAEHECLTQMRGSHKSEQTAGNFKHGGHHELHIAWVRRGAFVFLSEALRQTLSNLPHDGTLWK